MRRRWVRALFALSVVLAGCIAGISAIAGSPPRVGASARLTQTRLHMRPLGRLLPRSPLAAQVRVVNSPPGSFPFQVAQSADGIIVVHYYGESAAFAQQFVALAQADLAHPVRDTLGFSALRPITIYVYKSRGDFLAGAPVANAAETGALTDTGHSAIYLTSSDLSDDGAISALPHELTHAVFHQNEDVGQLEANFLSLFPLWLDEGLATNDEPAGESGAMFYAQTLTDAVQNKQLLNLFRQFAFEYPADVDRNALGYAEAHSFIGYLVSTYGRDALHTFLRGARDGQLDLAAESAFGADLASLESQWQVSLGLPSTVPFTLFLPVTRSAVPFTPGTLPARVSAVRALPLDAGSPLPLGWLASLGIVTLLALVRLVEARLRVRRERRLAAFAGPREGMTAPAGPRWFDWPLLLLPPPLALGAGYLAVRLDPLQAWSRGYQVATLVAIPLALLALLVWLLLREGSAGDVSNARGLGVVAALLLVIVPGIVSASLASAQARAYENAGAYASALRLYGTAGALGSAGAATDLARIHEEWGLAADSARDFTTATAQLRAAVALNAPGADEDRASLVSATQHWAAALADANQFAQAVRIDTDQAAAPCCDATCQKMLRESLGAMYVTWAGVLLAGGDMTQALAKLQLAAQTGPATDAGTAATEALRELGAQQDFDAALAAGASGDYATMNARLTALAAKYPQTAAAVASQEAPEPVSGVIQDRSGASVAGEQLIFLAFATAADASRFTFDFSADTSRFKVATTIGAGGAFTVRLAPGFWYVPCWDDPSQPPDDFNSPVASNNAAFTVQSLRPASAGTIVGY